MKKRECAVVQDLLVLYEDDMLQEESREMVEEHIRGCEECMHIYESASKDVSVTSDEAGESEKKQEDLAVSVMKKLKRQAAHKSVMVLGIILAVILVGILAANEICNRITDNFWGIAGMIYIIPTDEIEVSELYQLKNGDIYCTLKSDKSIGIREHSELIVPNSAYEKSTDEGVFELCLRERTLWEKGNVPEEHQVSAIFSTEREGKIEETGEKVVQRCAKIIYRGKTKKDKLIIWKRGMKTAKASEEIERKAIREYVRNNQIQKAVRECENLGWDSEEIIKVYEKDNDIGQIYGSNNENVEFKNDSSMFLFDE